MRCNDTALNDDFISFIPGKEFTGPFKIIVPDDNGHPLVDVAKIPASSTYSDGRLYTVNQASFRKRKQASIHNDHERSRYQLVSRSLERQRTITNHQLQKGSSSYRKSLTNLRTLGICLKSAHPAPVSTQPATELSPYGRYNGRSVKDFKYDVQKHIEQNSPQNRKLKKKDQLIQSGLGDGRIVPEKDIMDKFNSMIEKPFKPFKLSENNYFKRKDNSVLPQLGGGPKMVNLHGKGFSNFFATGSCVSFLWPGISKRVTMFSVDQLSTRI